MNKHIFLLLFWVLVSPFAMAKKAKTEKENTINQWLKAGAINCQLPAFNNTEDFNKNTYQSADFLKDNQLDWNNLTPAEGDHFLWNNLKTKWENITAEKGFVKLPNTKNQLWLMVSYITVNRWDKIDIQLETGAMAELFIDGKKQLSNYEAVKKPLTKTASVNLERGKHTVLVKLLSKADNNKFKVSLKAANGTVINTSVQPQHYLTIYNVLNGTKVKSSGISPDGKLVILNYSRTLPPSDKTERWSEIQEIISGRVIANFRGTQLSKMQWHPVENSISYTKNYNGRTTLFQYDLATGKELILTENIDGFGNYKWSPNGKFIIYSVGKDYASDWKIRKIQGMEDRLPWFRYRSFLYRLDIASGVKQRLTFGAVSTHLQDIRRDGRYILFTQSRPDYNEYPYDKQNLYQMNMETFAVDTIWKDKLFAGQPQYSPDGKQLLVQGGASCFGKTGENIGSQSMANNYDGQLYIFDLKSKKVNPITYNFNPSIDNAQWSSNGTIYIRAADKDCVLLYSYRNKQFTELKTQTDVVRNFSLSNNGTAITYVGCGISSPYKAFVYNTSSKTSNVLADPEKENLKNVIFGKTENWNFTKADGTTITGRVYYPPNFDKTKKYPVIVNYYAGTSPVSRSYGGRYPLNLYASMGYVVYLLQPSGATGFGQEFSARHQNNWGITTADEIIEGTKKFLKAHPFADAKHVGCIGASYGGFMTMLLQTRTNIFAAAIAHAGISNIASYWGEGYWGYSYSTNASGLSFPWNNRRLYVDQSPLFAADKIVTPLLLIHGSVDTNVPLGESIQMYQALKLLGKETDFVQVKNQDHHILNYTQRILWNNTIFAYFAKYLKNQPEWWNNMYPDKNL